MKKSLSLICIGLIISGCSLFSNIANADELSSFEKCKMSVDRATNAWRRYDDKMDENDIKGNITENLNVCNFGLDYNNIINSCEQSAKEGNAEAQFYLGYAHYMDWCKKPNHDTARIWIKKSADQNFSTAQTALVDFFGSSIDDIERKNLLEKAAKQNDLYAIQSLAFYYEIRHDFFKAIDYYKKGYKLRDAESARKLGDLSIIQKNDIKKALVWYEKGANLKTDLKFTLSVGKMYENGLLHTNYFNKEGKLSEINININKDYEKALFFYDLACKAVRSDNIQKLNFKILPTQPDRSYSKRACLFYNTLKSRL